LTVNPNDSTPASARYRLISPHSNGHTAATCSSTTAHTRRPPPSANNSRTTGFPGSNAPRVNNTRCLKITGIWKSCRDIGGADVAPPAPAYQHLFSESMPSPELLFQTRWLALFRIGHWDYVRRPNADSCVGILAITPDDEIILIEQFRIPIQRRVIEIPAGLVGDEEEFAGESLSDTAARELLEETGYRAASLRPLVVSPTSAGMTSEFIHIFLATGLTRENDGGGVGTEDIKVHLVPRSGIRAWLRDRESEGLAIDYKIHAALWLAEPHLSKQD